MLRLWQREFLEDLHVFKLSELALSAYIICFMNTIVILNILPSKDIKSIIILNDSLHYNFI